jgi:hypothetical protein
MLVTLARSSAAPVDKWQMLNCICLFICNAYERRGCRLPFRFAGQFMNFLAAFLLRWALTTLPLWVASYLFPVSFEHRHIGVLYSCHQCADAVAGGLAGARVSRRRILDRLFRGAVRIDIQLFGQSLRTENGLTTRDREVRGA